jgi:hypothetical protein
MAVKQRQEGDIVEVRWFTRGGRKGPSWRPARVLEGYPDGSVKVMFRDEPRVFERRDVRAKRKRVTTGKVRGRGGKGGWV